MTSENSSDKGFSYNMQDVVSLVALLIGFVSINLAPQSIISSFSLSFKFVGLITSSFVSEVKLMLISWLSSYLLLLIKTLTP